MDLCRFSMSDQMRLALRKCNLSFVEEIVLMTPEALSKKLGISLIVCQEFHENVRKAILPPKLEISNSQTEGMITGLQGLDDLGGIASGQLFEVFGEAGCIFVV